MTVAHRTNQLEIVVTRYSTEEYYTPVTLEQCMNLLEQPEQLPTLLIEGPPGIIEDHEVLLRIILKCNLYRVFQILSRKHVVVEHAHAQNGGKYFWMALMNLQKIVT